jgi:ribonuclease-3
MRTAANLEKLEKNLGVTFQEKALLLTALTHRSYLNEHPWEAREHNERLEFLGDAVLELIVTHALYDKYPGKPEGELTNLRAAVVRGEMLSQIAERLRIDSFMRLSRGERKSKGKARQFILANAMEAIIGAIYLDQGFAAAQKFVRKHILSELPRIIQQRLYIDNKSLFQELAQEKFRITPTYKVLKEEGPDHARIFTVGVYLKDELWGTGTGTNKQEAQQAAAHEALHKLSAER